MQKFEEPRNELKCDPPAAPSGVTPGTRFAKRLLVAQLAMHDNDTQKIKGFQRLPRVKSVALTDENGIPA